MIGGAWPRGTHKSAPSPPHVLRLGRARIGQLAAPLHSLEPTNQHPLRHPALSSSFVIEVTELRELRNHDELPQTRREDSAGAERRRQQAQDQLHQGDVRLQLRVRRARAPEREGLHEKHVANTRTQCTAGFE